jgi:putative SOS response-associated peptidase YedK
VLDWPEDPAPSIEVIRWREHAFDPDAYDLWLDPGFTDVAAASELLKPYDATAMRCYPGSARVSNAANDDAECSAPVEVAREQARLF